MLDHLDPASDDKDQPVGRIALKEQIVVLLIVAGQQLLLQPGPVNVGQGGKEGALDQ